MNILHFAGVQLHEGEKIVKEGKPSIFALAVTWLVIPIFLLISAPSYLRFLLKINVFKIIFIIAMVLLIPPWIGYCLVMTWRHSRYALAVTDLRVIGRASKETMDSPLGEIKNVMIERSLWGKLLGYGNIVVQTKNACLTFRNVHRPKELYEILMHSAQEYCAHF